MNNPRHLEESLQITQPCNDKTGQVISLPPNSTKTIEELKPIQYWNAQHSVQQLMDLDPMYTSVRGGWRYKKSTGEADQYTAKLAKDGQRVVFYGTSDGRKGLSCDSFELMKLQKGVSQTEAVRFVAQNTYIDPADPNSKTIDQENKYFHPKTIPDAPAAFAKAGVGNIDAIQNNANPAQSPLEKLKVLSATNRLSEMTKNMRNETFILENLASNGQITLLFGKPNSGKTLFVLCWLINAIKSGLLKGVNIFYFNADDNFKGLYIKTEIAEHYEISMISPAESGVSTDDILALLESTADSGEAKDMIIIIDTVKKFTNVMHKGKQNEFFTGLRRVVAKGGTIILLGHANKHTDADDNLIYEGTSDILNDIDAAYSLNIIERDDIKTVVEFRCEKSRGNNIQRVSYGYVKSENGSYQDLLDSVYKLDDEATRASFSELGKKQTLDRYKDVLPFLDNLLSTGSLNQSEIISAYDQNRGDTNGVIDFSKRQLTKSLSELDGIFLSSVKDYSGNNSTIYSLKFHMVAPPEPPARRP